jgi:hypothetical protein
MSALANKNRPPAPVRYSGLNVGTSQFDLPIPIFWGQRRLTTNAIGFDHFTKQPANGKGKGGGAKSQQAYDYHAAVLLGLCEGVVDSIPNTWANGSTTTTTTLSHLGMTFYPGTATQSPVAGGYPMQALAYALTAYLAHPRLDLGESATIPDNAFECVRTAGFAYTHPSSGWINPNTHVASPAVDCLMSDIITDFLTSPQYGLGFTSADLGPIAQYAAYQRAQGLFFSPLLNSPEKATAILDRWALVSNVWIYWSGTQLQFVPLADAPIAGNGAAFTPQNDVAYNLGLADFIAETGQDAGPVKAARLDPADCHNRTVLNLTDRTLGYISNPLEFKDQTLVDQFGLRDNANVQGDEICDPGVGRIVVQLLGKRAAYIRNTYSFKTSYRYILCLPGTILTLTEPNLGLSQVRVRVRTISEDDKGQLSFVCEEFPGTAATYIPPINAPAVNTATTPDQLVDPGSVNTPAIVEPVSAFTGGTPKIIVAASGGASWGGCTVNLSFDGTNYSQVGTISAAATQGLLTAALAAYGGANPDTGHTLAVDCTESQAAPSTAVTYADAVALRSLSLVAAQPTLVGGAYVVPANGELLAFGAVTPTGAFAANLTWLERGAYGTSAGAHSIGDQFTLFNVAGTDGTSIAFDLPPQYVGQTLYLKLASFNVFGLANQDVSTCLEYQYSPTGAGFQVVATADANIPAGAFVYVYDSAGVKHVAIADNATADYANGFVLSAVASGNVGVVQTSGFNSAAVVAANLPQVWLGTAGAYVTTAPTAPGATVQVIGNAVIGKGVYFLPATVTQLPRALETEGGTTLETEGGTNIIEENHP